MKPVPRERTLMTAGILALAAILVVLAVLQYRWSEELHDGARVRMMASLQASLAGFREDFSRELSGLAFAFQIDGDGFDAPADGELFVQRLEAWKRTAAHPALADHILLCREIGEDKIEGARLNLATGQFETLEASSGNPFEKLLLTPGSGPARVIANLPPGPGGPERWFIEVSAPALLRPYFRHPQGPNPPPAPPRPDWIVVELNADVMREKIFPELAQRHFGGPEGMVYDVAVVRGDEQRQVIYSSGLRPDASGSMSGDASLNLFGPPGPPRGPFMPSPGSRHHFPHRPPEGMASFEYRGALRLEPLGSPPSGGEWELIARHREGSVEAAVAALQRRHLAVSFGVLLVLALTMAMLVVGARRAQDLARLQMDFVTGISHELRTPLTVIASAADNLADGIIEDKAKQARYGMVIREQARQLSHLVEQILRFAAARQNRQDFHLTLLAPEEIVRHALASSAESIRAAGCTVEQQIEPELPLVQADLPAVSHCLQNLIMNAVKYGGEARWIGVQAGAANAGAGREVQIRIADRGAGIEPGDLPRIFDPFYRGAAARKAQIHGSGLGLALARNIAEGMGGRLSVASQPGQGSVFVLHLPCAEEMSNQPQASSFKPEGPPACSL
jgi:signal transduction histidine kinase